MTPTRPLLDEADLRSLLGELGREARAFRFRAAPNPCVGAAVLAGEQVVGRGFHEGWGGAHAEVQALRAAAQSGTPPEEWDALVVTLEPCSSRGKTEPCTRAILESGIPRVVVGALDPDPRHRGRGLELLVEAGVEVEVLRHSAPLEEVTPHFLRWTHPDRLRRPRPWTLAKWAQTRTGQLTPPADVGDGRWISGPTSLSEVQVMRGRVDAIVTGVGTVLADDPRLTVRSPGDRNAPPMRVVLDTTLRTPPDARLFAAPGEDEAGGSVHVLCRAGAPAKRHRDLEAAGAEIHPLRPGDTGHLSLRAAQEWAWDRGIRRQLLEAGPTLLEAFFERGFIDQLSVYTGNVNGGRGPSLAERLAPHNLEDPAHRESGEDAILEAFVRSLG